MADPKQHIPCYTITNINNIKTEIEFNQDEIEVAHTLLNLPYLLSKSLSSYRFSYSWGSTRRRSALPDPPTPPTPPPPPPPLNEAVLKPQTTSPDTPLAFVATESDHKSKRTPVKRTRGELQLMVGERIQTQRTLIKEINKVKVHLEKLKGENLELKVKKQKLMGSVEEWREKRKLEVSEDMSNRVAVTAERIQQRITAVNDQLHAGPLTAKQFHHQPPSIPDYHQQHGLMINRTADVIGQIQYHHQVRQLGPFGFDLNVSAEEMSAMEINLQPLDQRLVTKTVLDRISSAAARRKNRIQINKSKKLARVR